VARLRAKLEAAMARAHARFAEIVEEVTKKKKKKR
jgi:hypothetical protein